MDAAMRLMVFVILIASFLFPTTGIVYAQHRPTEDVLKKRMSIWLKYAPMCNGHPSKLHEDTGANCNDGDMALFSGLLCASGFRDARNALVGCDSVAASQDAEGRWYRSPRRKLDPTIDEYERKDNIASFSPDMALGVQLYLLASRNVAQGNLWMKWLDEHRPCWGGNEPDCRLVDVRTGLEIRNARGLPRFCTDSPGPPQPNESEGDRVLRLLRIDPRCSMRPGDLAILGQTRVGLSLYNVTQEDRLACLQASAIANDFQERIKNLDRMLNLTKWENIIAIINGGLPYVLGLACAEGPTWIRLNAEFNDKGFSQHLVAVSILQLRRLGINNELLRDSAIRLAAKQPQNPFYLFLKNGKTEQVLSKILQHCPKDEAESKNSKKSQWLWERESTETNWKGTSSLWDCLFIGSLWIQGG